MPRSDAELVEAACQGDLASFGQLYERHYRMAVGIARSRLSDRHLAEDAAQEAFAIACRTLCALRDRDRYEKFNAASFKDAKDRTAAEKNLIEIRDKIMLREIYRSPVRQFEEDHCEPNTFHYVGTGVKVGQADRIVCWYKLRNAAKYRVLYGDLSVKEATAAELPINLSKEAPDGFNAGPR